MLGGHISKSLFLSAWALLSLVWLIVAFWLLWPNNIAPYFDLQETIARCSPEDAGCLDAKQKFTMAEKHLYLSLYLLASVPAGLLFFLGLVRWIYSSMFDGADDH